MKKLLIVGGAVTGVAGAAFLAKRFASSSRGPDFERWIERMPENAPPRWIFRNVTAIRENTERILQLLEREDRSEAS
jgi:cyanophycinase-like exopeptidase